MTKERGSTGLRTKLVKRLREVFPRAVVIAHEDRYTYGVLDISFTYRGRTDWLEVKVASPTLRKGKKIQLFVALELAREGNCHYVIYREGKLGERSTFITTPLSVKHDTWSTDYLLLAFNRDDWDHDLVVNFLKKARGEL